MNRRKKNEGFTLAELLITIAIMGILMGFGFVEVISQQRRLKLKEADEIAKQIYLGAQNHLTGSWASGEWQALINTKPASYFGVSGLIDSSAETREGHTYFYISNYPSSEHDALSDVILPYGSIDETIRSNGTYVIDYDLTTATVYEVFYIGYKTQINAEDVANAKNNSLGVWDRIQYAMDHRLNNKPRYVGYYGVGEVELGPVSNYNPASISVKNEENLWLEITDSNIDKHPNDVLTVIISGKLSNAKVALRIPLDNSSTSISNQYKPVPNNERYISDNDVQMYYESPYLAKSEIVGNNRVYYVLLDSLTFDRNITIQYPEDKKEGKGVFGQFGKHFGVKYGFFVGENLSIQAYLNDPTTGDESFTETPEFANSLFNNLADPENADETYSETGASDYIAMIKNARHLQNLSMDASGITYQPTKIGETNNTFNFVGARLENDIDWNMYAANLSSCPSSKTGISDFCNEWKTLRTNRYNIVTNNNSAEVRHEDGMYFRPISNGYTSGVKWPRFQKSTFDFYGRGLHIFNLDIYRYDADLGLFAQSRDGANLRIHDLNLVDPHANVVETSNFIGLFCAKVSGDGGAAPSLTIDNCHAYMSSDDEYKAGSFNISNNAINSSTGKGIQGRSSAIGGLIGTVEKNGKAYVYNSSASVPIVNDLEDNANNPEKLSVGGLIGYGEGIVVIQNCYVGGYAESTMEGGFVDYSSESANLAIVSTKKHFHEKGWIGGIAGKLSGDQIVIENCYSTASIYYGIENTNLSGYAGGFVGELPNNSKSKIQNCYSAGRVLCLSDYPGNYGAFLGRANGNYSNVKDNYYFDYSGFVSQFGNEVRHVDGNYTANISGLTEVSNKVSAFPYNTALGYAYPFTPVSENAAISINGNNYRHYGDWPHPKPLEISFDGNFGIIYYEIVQHGTGTSSRKDAYYHGWIANASYENDTVYTEVSTYNTLSSPGILTKGILDAPNGGEYVVEDGYLLILKKNMDPEATGVGTNSSPITINSFDNSLFRIYEDIDDILNIRGFDCYFIDPYAKQGNEYVWKNYIEYKHGIDWQLYLKPQYNFVSKATIYFDPFFANEISLSAIGTEHVVRSASGLKKLFDITGGRYISVDSMGRDTVTQIMDINFSKGNNIFTTCGSDGHQAEYTDCYTSPTLSTALVGTYSSIQKTNGEYYKLSNLNKPFISGGLMASGLLKDLVVENAATSYFVGGNAGTISNIRFKNCQFRNLSGDVSNNGLVNGDNSGLITNLYFDRSTISDNTIALANSSTISDITITNSYIGHNGISESNSYSNGLIRNISIDNVKIDTGNGLTGTNNRSIVNCRLSNLLIGKNGCCDEISNGSVENVSIINAQIGNYGFAESVTGGSIKNCHIYGDKSVYDNYVKAYSNKNDRQYEPNPNTKNDFGQMTDVYGYNFVTIGLGFDKAKSTVSGDHFGFIKENGSGGRIEGCSITGKVYGAQNASGFIGTAGMSGNITNSYSNSLVSSSGTAAGFFIKNEGSDITNCLALGVMDGNTQSIGFGGDQAQNNGDVNYSYCVMWNKRPNNFKQFTNSSNTDRFNHCYYLNNDTGTIPMIPGHIEPISAQQLTNDAHGLGSYISRSKSHPYHQFNVIADTYPFPMPVYNGSGLDEYGDWDAGLDVVTVTFDAFGNDAKVEGVDSNTRTISFYKGKEIGELPTATWSIKDHGTLQFLGWYRSSDPFSSDKIDEHEVISEDVTYYAHWAEITEYSQKDSYQSFKPARAGVYKFEVWGAGSENTSSYDGRYSQGFMYIDKDKQFYVKTGKNGAESGISTSNSSTLADYNKSRIMVSSGANPESGYYSREVGVVNNSFVSGNKDGNAVANIDKNTNLLFTGQNIHHSGWAFADATISNSTTENPSGDNSKGFVRISRIVLDSADTIDAKNLTLYSGGRYGGQVFDVKSTATTLSVDPDTITVYVGEELTKRQIVDHFELNGTVTTTVTPKTGKVIDTDHLPYESSTEYKSNVFLSDIPENDITITNSDLYELSEGVYKFVSSGTITNNTIKYNKTSYKFNINIDPSLVISYEVYATNGELRDCIISDGKQILSEGEKTAKEIAEEGYKAVSEKTSSYPNWYKYKFQNAVLWIDGEEKGNLASIAKTEDTTSYTLVGSEPQTFTSTNVKVILNFTYDDNLEYKLISNDPTDPNHQKNPPELHGYSGSSGKVSVIAYDGSNIEEGFDITSSVQLSSNNADIATVDKAGNVSYISKGITGIKAVVDEDHSYFCKVFVREKEGDTEDDLIDEFKAVKIKPESIEDYVGKEVQLSLSGVYTSGYEVPVSDNITWSVSNVSENEDNSDNGTSEAKIISISQDGIVKLENVGTAKAVATYVNGEESYSGECEITVLANPVIELTSTFPNGIAGSTYDEFEEFKVEAKYEDGTTIDITNLENVFTYDNSAINIIGAEHKVSLLGKSGSYTIAVAYEEKTINIPVEITLAEITDFDKKGGFHEMEFEDKRFKLPVYLAPNTIPSGQDWSSVTAPKERFYKASSGNVYYAYKDCSANFYNWVHQFDTVISEWNGLRNVAVNPTIKVVNNEYYLFVNNYSDPTTATDVSDTTNWVNITEYLVNVNNEQNVNSSLAAPLSLLGRKPGYLSLSSINMNNIKDNDNQNGNDDNPDLVNDNTPILPTSSPVMAALMEDAAVFKAEALEPEQIFVTADTYDVEFYIDQKDAVLPNLWKRVGDNKFRVNPYDYEWHSDDEDVVVCDWGEIEVKDTGETDIRTAIDGSDVTIHVTVSENQEITGFKEKGSDYSVSTTDGGTFSAETKKWPTKEPKENTADIVKVYGTRIVEESGAYYLIADDFEADWDKLVGNIGSYLSDADEDGNHYVVKLPVGELLDEDDFFEEDGAPKVELLPGDAYRTDDTVYVVINSNKEIVKPEVSTDGWFNLKDMKEYVPGADTGPETDLLSYPGAAFNPYPGTIKSNCTYAVWALVNQTLGIKLPAWGNAGSWLRRAGISGYATGNKPAKYSIIVFDTHVGFITDISEDGTMIYVKEGNYGGKYHEQWWRVGKVRGSQNVQGYIYLTDDTGNTFAPVTVFIDSDFHGTEEEFKNVLVEIGLEAGEKTEVNDDEIPAGHIIDYTPTGEVAKGSVINYRVSKGPEASRTFDVDETFVNQTEAELLDWFDKNGKLKGSRIVVDADGNSIEDEDDHNPSNYVVVSIKTGEYEEGAAVSYTVTKKVQETEPSVPTEDPVITDPETTDSETTNPETVDPATSETVTPVPGTDPQQEAPAKQVIIEGTGEETQPAAQESTIVPDSGTEITGEVTTEGGEVVEEVVVETPAPTLEATLEPAVE